MQYRWIGENTNGGGINEEGYAVQGGKYGGRGVTLYGNGEAVEVSYNSSMGSRSMYLGKDILGSVRSMTADTGMIEDRYEYDAFGAPYQGDLSGWMNLGYTGKPYDRAAGLYNYGFRDYRPQTARFTTEDPVRDGNNWFAYVNNDPVNWIDPWGLSAIDGKSNWIDNGNGTYTAKAGATLSELYGADWQAKSGFDRDPRTLQVGETVGIPNATTLTQNNPTSPIQVGGISISDLKNDIVSPQFSVVVNDSPNKVNWDQVALGVVDVTAGILGMAGSYALNTKAKSPAMRAFSYPLFLESYQAFLYGIAEIGNGFSGGKTMPGFERIMMIKRSMGFTSLYDIPGI